MDEDKELKEEDIIGSLKEIDKTLSELEGEKQATAAKQKGKTVVLDIENTISNLDDIKFPEEIRVSNLSDIEIPPMTPESFPEEIRISNLDEIKIPTPQFPRFPDSIGIKKPAWLPLAFAPLKPIKDTLDEISSKLDNKNLFKFPTEATEPIPVRLSDGEQFINQLTQWVTTSGGGGSVPKVRSTTTPEIYGVPVVNPDGTDIGGGSGTAAYSDSGGTDRKGLVDADRHVQVDVLTMPAVSIDTTGLATSANQTTIIGHLDGVEGLLTTIDADTSTLAGAVSGTEMQVDVVTSALPTGAATLAEQQTQTTALQLIDNLVKSIDTATGATDSGIINLATRDDSLSTLTPIEGDNVPLRVDSVGALWVNGSAFIQPVSATNLDIRDLTNADVVTAELSAVDNAVLDTIAAKDFATQTTLAAINAKLVTGTDIGDVTINNSTGAAAVNIQDGGNTITVDGTVAVTNSDITSIKTATELIDDAIFVDDTATHSTGTTKIIGIGGVAVPTDTAISANDIGMFAMSLDRRQLSDVTLQIADADVSSTNAVPTKGVPSDIDINGSNANHADKYYTNAGAVTDGIIWSPAAGKRWHVLTLYINVSAAATVTLEDDLAGGDVVRWKGELAANSGVVLTYDKEHPFSSTEDAADLIITTTAGNVYVQAVGYEV